MLTFYLPARSITQPINHLHILCAFYYLFISRHLHILSASFTANVRQQFPVYQSRQKVRQFSYLQQPGSRPMPGFLCLFETPVRYFRAVQLSIPIWFALDSIEQVPRSRCGEFFGNCQSQFLMVGCIALRFYCGVL